MQLPHSIFLKKAPFLRIVIALMIGIMLQWHTGSTPGTWLATGLISIAMLICFSFGSLFSRFKLGYINGIAISLLFITLGGFLTGKKDCRNDKKWIGNYENENGFIVVLDEPLQEKPKSFKALAVVKAVVTGKKIIPASGKIIIYFKKDSLPLPGFGDRILFHKPVEEIRNAGNPGGFDYKEYGILHGFTHQVFLERNEYELAPCSRNKFRQFIYQCQGWLLGILRKNIRGEKELGLAEALLIGYKDDLDKSLVQSYSNTGVVHIIAISGLHLGLIYMLLALLTRPLKKIKKIQWLRFLLIIVSLWLFTLLAGAQPSILRSAIMFTCIAAGDMLYKKASVYNTLALSAFILLCINPFWLWDLGFQLSYTAVLSIIIFQRPIYNLLYTPNKILDLVWKLNAVTLAAQILTIPLTIYYFHQFPNFFLLTNFIAVPLSSLILMAEIGLCSISFLPGPAEWIGQIISGLIKFMNRFIERVDSIDIASSQGLLISWTQVGLMYLLIIFFTAWLNQRWRNGFLYGLLVLLVFCGLRTISFMEANRQQKLLVYNVPRKQAIDIIQGRYFQYIGDSMLNIDPYARHFYLEPSRTYLRTGQGNFPDKILKGNGWLCRHHTLVISAAAQINYTNLNSSTGIDRIIFDSSVPAWKIRQAKPILDSLGISYHDVASGGAFMMDLE